MFEEGGLPSSIQRVRSNKIVVTQDLFLVNIHITKSENQFFSEAGGTLVVKIKYQNNNISKKKYK